MEDVLNELSLNIRAHYPLVYLLSWEEDRALRGVERVAQDLGRPLRRWSVVSGLWDGDEQRIALKEPVELLSEIARWTSPAIVVLHGFHRWIDDALVIRHLRDLRAHLAAQQITLVLLSPVATVPYELEKDVVVLDVPLPSIRDIARLLAALLQGESIEMDLDLFERFVKASLGLTEEELKRVYAKVLLKAGGMAEAQLDDVISEKGQIIRRSEYLEFHALRSTIQDVGGLDNLKEWLRARSSSFSEKARKFGLPQPKGLFLVGIQGCGKSLTAKAVAQLWKVPLLRLDVATLLSSASSTEEGLRRTIQIAESMAPVVLWVDEIEKAFAGVSSGGADSAAATRIFGNFVTWLQEKQAPVFVIATANEVANLPPELLRKGRFDEIFFIDLPNIHEREAIFEIHLRGHGRDPKDFNCWELAELTDKYSGAEVEQAVISGMFHAFTADREVTTRDILTAIRETVPLAVTMDERIKALKEWARTRTRPATWDTRKIDFFEDWDGQEPELGLEDIQS